MDKTHKQSVHKGGNPEVGEHKQTSNLISKNKTIDRDSFTVIYGCQHVGQRKTHQLLFVKTTWYYPVK